MILIWQLRSPGSIGQIHDVDEIASTLASRQRGIEFYRHRTGRPHGLQFWQVLTTSATHSVMQRSSRRRPAAQAATLSGTAAALTGQVLAACLLVGRTAAAASVQWLHQTLCTVFPRHANETCNLYAWRVQAYYWNTTRVRIRQLVAVRDYSSNKRYISDWNFWTRNSILKMAAEPEVYFSNWRPHAAILDFEKLMPFLDLLINLTTFLKTVIRLWDATYLL